MLPMMVVAVFGASIYLTHKSGQYDDLDLLKAGVGLGLIGWVGVIWLIFAGSS